MGDGERRDPERRDERRETIGITFHCRCRGGVVTLSDEHEEWKWVPLGAIVDGAYPEWMRRAAQIVEGQRAD